MSLVNQVLKDLENTSPQSSNMKLQAVNSKESIWFGSQSSRIIISLLILTLVSTSYLIWSRDNSQSEVSIATAKTSQKIDPVVEPQKAENTIEEKASSNKSTTSLKSKISSKKAGKNSSLVVASNESPVKLEKNLINEKPIISRNETASKKKSLLTTHVSETSTKKQAKPSSLKTTANEEVDSAEKSSQVKVSSNKTILKKELNQILNEKNVFGINHTIKRLEDFVSINPSYDQARLQLIKLSWTNQRTRLASILDESIKASPNQSAFYIASARYYLEENQQKMALGVINQYENLNNSAELLKFRALIQQKLGNHKDAVLDYQKVIKLSSANDSIYLALGISLEAIGEFEHAKNSYRKALSGRSLSNQQVRFVENKLNSLQG